MGIFGVLLYLVIVFGVSILIGIFVVKKGIEKSGVITQLKEISEELKSIKQNQDKE